ncbi:MAG: serine/threonine-protein kinase [Longimicrobiales bacterium]|nr:serine/threonine-protein kinase [Longimicrobiales bacterium]
MGDPRWEQIRDLYEAVRRLPPDAQDEALRDMAGDDAELREEVRSLLAADRQGAEILRSEGGEAASLIAGSDAHPAIGPYRLIELLGRGGMGEVWRAEQTHPMRREVAIKIVQSGMESDQILARFELERQALALMDHPNIARIYDAGITPDDRPYFAMELVRGQPISEYCDDRRLGTRDRVELFAAVCDAVGHAHQKGIVHRDLKPSNILVNDADGRPTPKVIDFGIAKAIGPSPTPNPAHTRADQSVGTPAYMSPEQSGGASLDVDTRADVYSLGIVLYELLVGRRPYEIRHLLGPALRRHLLDISIPRPSTKLESLDTREEIAQRRATSPRELMSQLRGDLDWIVLKASDPDRNRRYGTVQGLGEDLRRFLHFEPVEARPPSLAYRVGKLARRHRVAFASALIGLVLVVLALGGTTWGLVRATRAEEQARAEAEASEAMASFLADLFSQANPVLSDPDSVTARQLLDRGREVLTGDSLSAWPLARARVSETMGAAYFYAGLLEPAAELLGMALGIRDSLQGPGHPAGATLATDLAMVLRRQGRMREADSLLARAVGALAPHRDSLPEAYALSLQHRGIVADMLGEYDRAAVYVDSALVVLEGVFGPDDPYLADVLHSRALIDLALEDWDAAERGLIRVIELEEQAGGPETPWLIRPMHNLGYAHQAGSDLEAARAAYARALELAEINFGPEHPDVISNLRALGDVARLDGNLAGAEIYYQRALGRIEATDAAPRDRAHLVLSLGQLAVRQSRLDEARDHLERARTDFESIEAHPETERVRALLADLDRRQGALDRAEMELESVIRDLERRFGSSSPTLTEALELLALVYRDGGRPADADEVEERVRALEGSGPGD